MKAEDTVAWEGTYRRHRDEFLALREFAQAEIDARQNAPHVRRARESWTS